MSEIVRNDVSTESLCTVIENFSGNNSTNSKHNTSRTLHKNSDDQTNVSENPNVPSKEIIINLATSSDVSDKSLYDTCDTSQEESNTSRSEAIRPSTKLKKSVSFDPQDEKVRKFIAGEPIVDQKNPFKQNYSTWANSAKKKKIPPPVPTKRSTLSVRKTVTQQLREREREKEKEKERLKNETNNRKSSVGVKPSLPSPDDFVTTEEVLNQSKYVKTYIKNPDPYFVYDPTILARLKCEELRDLAEKKPQQKKLRLSNQTRDRIKDLKSKPSAETSLSYSKLPFKKCSKPNYPDLSDIKIKVGTDLDGNFFNPAEVSKNAKKFDDRVKKLHISSDDDLDELDCPLTKSESSDEVTPNLVNKEIVSEHENKEANAEMMNAESQFKTPVEGTFTDTIKSKEFQEYLEKKGLTLIPKKIPNGARPVYTNGIDVAKSNPRISFKSPESVQISVDTTDAARNFKKPSVFQRLLSNSIFATRRKTTPKDIVPTPRSLCNYNTHVKESNDNLHPSMKRVILERQSFHGRPRATNILSSAETDYLKHQDERSRKSYASGDNISLSLSSVLTNAELTHSAERNVHTPIMKPPRRTHSRERLGNAQQAKPSQQSTTILKPRAQRFPAAPISEPEGTLKRTAERQSLIPKRTTQTLDRRQMFGRSSSMDRNEILKKRLVRELQNRSKSDNEASKVSTPLASKENIREQFSTLNGPKLTSTPIRNVNSDNDRKDFVQGAKTTNKIYVDQQEWERLKAMKDRMDKELYFRMLQEQKLQQDAENIYERLQPTQQILIAQPSSVSTQPRSLETNFIRGSPQRNTFSGLTKNRQAKIIDGRALIPTAAEYPLTTMQSIPSINHSFFEATPRSQSVLDNMTLTSRHSNGNRKGYESDVGTPVVLRRKDNNPTEHFEQPEQRRIGGILTRDEILQKVKEFCRKSLNKTPTLQQPQVVAINKKQPGPSDLSPVSYASVETNLRPPSRMYAAPQVPQRMQSLPQQFIPINPNTSSPIYAHVVKRSSLLSNHSGIYDSPLRTSQEGRDVEAPAMYISRGSLAAPQFVLVEGDKWVPATQVIGYYPSQSDIYAQPHYVRPYKLQPVPGAYGYISVREPQPRQQLRPRLHDGRSTPLILDNSSQQTSQIYWAPHNQRLQQHNGLLPVDISSPRYIFKQLHPQSTTGMEIGNNKPIPNAAGAQQQPPPKIERGCPPTNRQHQMKISTDELRDLNIQHPYEWESGSEAGEVQRILENPRNSGEFREINFLRNLKKKFSRFLF
ncbi:PREDICTED: uncharacterized protein LOC108360210 isoform X2 [Rhagoletis zephyria]|uniref:uncharacterized protein LOC108360210 isoform X2 n=1 Tax=Rhagoletis zephyria TaxID=28612 RepID=UPI0008115F1D|nr:PREDICTED: uncharacterized protein LOC108360210 isoform X2 [Rhagoletis zephyria]